MDDDEPYSPGGSDDNDMSLNTISSSFLAGSTSNSIPEFSKPIMATSSKLDQENQMQREMEEINRQIEAEKKQIALHLQTADIDEPYSPTNSVSPPINTNISDVVSTSSNSALANISIPANLADILKNIAASSNQVMPMNQYNPLPMDANMADSEYIPSITPSTTSMLGYTTVASNEYGFTTSMASVTNKMSSSEPSKLAQLTDEELLKLVPDEIELAPPTKRPKYDLRPPGIDDDDEIPL